jgi:hypothetical protein
LVAARFIVAAASRRARMAQRFAALSQRLISGFFFVQGLGMARIPDDAAHNAAAGGLFPARLPRGR